MKIKCKVIKNDSEIWTDYKLQIVALPIREVINDDGTVSYKYDKEVLLTDTDWSIRSTDSTKRRTRYIAFNGVTFGYDEYSEEIFMCTNEATV